MSFHEQAAKVTNKITTALGSVTAVVASAALIVGWAATGPLFGFGDTWQLVINTTTTIITFLMVFILQNSQNRDGRAIQTKLDAILEAVEAAPNEDIGIEELPEEEIKRIQESQRARVNDSGEQTQGQV